MQSVFDILEWPQVLAHLESCCQTGYGRSAISQEGLFLPEVNAVTREMNRVDEAKRLLMAQGDISLSEPPDVLPLIRRLMKQGQAQSSSELGALLMTLTTLRQLVRFFIQNRSREVTPTLLSELEEITLPNAVIERLETVVNAQGELLDSASPEYARLKHRIQETRSGIRSYLQQLIHRHSFAKYLQEAIVTEREGRSVLPVKVEHKPDVPGIVHGASSTGVTLYIEPKGVIEQNNRLIALRGDMEREIRRILEQTSLWLQEEAQALERFIEQAGALDLLLAKARQSLLLKANPLQVLDTPGVIELKQAKHPLLMLQTESVIANDIIMRPPHQIMLITGPNTGGKTVLLKLLGLFSLMLRAGLHVPVAEGSAMALFDPVMADIGDPQSITQSLSTFSGHIARLRSFLEPPDLSRALILVDEICAGTDPQEGSALAQALLETFYERGATAIVTTHIGELKVAAHQHEGYLNASVEFDAESLRPTYRLLLGVPGSSNALYIAERLGLPPDLISLARSRLTKPVSESANLIESLELKNRQLSQELAEATRLRQELQWEEEQVRNTLNRIEGEKKKTLQLYREGLKDKLRGIEQDVDALKDEVRRPKRLDRKSVQQLSGKFRHAQRQTGELFGEEARKLYPNPGIDWDSLKVGDTVSSHSLNLTGTIVEKNEAKKELTLQSGILKTTVPFSDIIQQVKQPSNTKKSKHRSSEKGSGRVHLQPRQGLPLECDVRGMTSEDALGILDKFLDDALVTGVSTINIIHGMGTGVLKKAVRQYLKEIPFVKAFGPAPAMEGGDGKTIVEL